MLLRIIVGLDNPKLMKSLAHELVDDDVVVEQIRPSRQAWNRLLRQSGDIIVVSQSIIPQPLDSNIALLNELPEMPTTVIITDSESPEHHADLLACGCDTVLYSELSSQRLSEAINATIHNRRQLQQRGTLNEPARMSMPKLSDFISESPVMQMFMQVVQRVVSSSASLMILGETGVGKEHLARAIHAESPRAAGPFVAVNCAALPEQLLESELFGHEEGAFTGATRRRRGAFEMAHTGTLYLDEIGEMPLHLQAKLLRVLQDYQVRRVGGEQTIDVDVRIMTSSNRDLEAETNTHLFRKDLYFRLSVVSLTVPPLRDRQEDIPILTQGIITRLARRIGVDVIDIESSVMQKLCQYNWPGNIRELINVLERALLLCENTSITMADIPANISGVTARSIPQSAEINQLHEQWVGKSLAEVRDAAMESIERAYLDMVLGQARGRVGKAAEIAGIHPRGLYNKMQKLGLRKDGYRG